jgi:hypothetical protein
MTTAESTDMADMPKRVENRTTPLRITLARKIVW